MRTTILVLLGAIVAACLAADKTPAPPKFTAEQVAFYEKQVLPILKEHCLKCHGAPDKKVRGNLYLDTRTGVLEGGDLGPAVIPGKLDASPMFKALKYADEKFKMPPKGKLPQAKIDVLVKWAEMGLPVPPERVGVARARTKKGKEGPWWAYQPVKRPPLPEVKAHQWVSSPIDAFLLAKLEATDLTPAKPAERTALVRRLYFGLTGLPPTPEQVDAFVNDKRPDAYERLVDQLLASPAYGEKWGRHWLDLVRYAESHGYERDSAKPFAWRFRDWAIRAFNDNVPYDQFIKDQLAGDQLRPDDHNALIATGYYRLGIWDDEPADPLQAKYDVLDGVVSTTSSVFLGLSVGCARCHDHKKDPIPQKDYYRLLAYFGDVSGMNRENLIRASTGGPRRKALLRDKQRREAAAFGKLYAQQQDMLASIKEKKGVDLSSLVGTDMEGLSFRYYRDAWHKFVPLVPVHEGKLAGNRFTLEAAPEKDRMALVFEGKLKVPAAGEYTFEITSSDGARLILDGKHVIDRPGMGKATKSAKATLRGGLLPVRLEYFNTTTKAELSVLWSGPGFAKRALSETSPAGRVLVADARSGGSMWRYRPMWTNNKFRDPNFDDKTWKVGKGGFGTRGTPGAVIGTEWKSSLIFLRQEFKLDSRPAALMLDVHHDEDVEVSINGKVVYQARGFLTGYKRVPLGPEAVIALKEGRNVVAVRCKQTAGGQFIDVGLSGAGADLDGLLREHVDPAKYKDYAALKAKLAAIRAEVVPDSTIAVMGVREEGPTTTRVLVRGNPHSPGDEVAPGTPVALGKSSAVTRDKRSALAEWVALKHNPMTARVMANRVWQYHFGRGIVPSTSDFGKLGELPTHPELLDWLASELMDSDWDLKHLHRVILLSSAYRMSSKGDPKALAKDGANMLFWRFPMRRLTAEEVRDSVLAVSGQLNRQMAGPPIYPPIPKAVLAGQSVPGAGWGKSSPAQASRRSVYVHVKRSLLLPILEVHDAADTDSSCPVRYTTTVPTQSLGMLNGEFTNEQAGLFADRLLAKTKDLDEIVRRVIRLTTGRVPKEDEVKADVAFIEKMRKEEGLDLKKAVASYCLMAINTNEFLYLD